MSLSEITKKVLRLVETRSGIPVHVEPDPSLPGTLLAKVVMARGALALHRVSYRSDSASPPDYLICSQAGFILRLFDTPPEKRFDFAASPEGDAAVERLVKAHPAGRALPPQAVPQLSSGELQKLSLDLAMAGRDGFAVHNPNSRYRVKGLDGEFSGLAMVCFLYVAMQRMAPGTDIGFDLAAEYEQAKKIFDAES